MPFASMDAATYKCVRAFVVSTRNLFKIKINFHLLIYRYIFTCLILFLPRIRNTLYERSWTQMQTTHPERASAIFTEQMANSGCASRQGSKPNKISLARVNKSKENKSILLIPKCGKPTKKQTNKKPPETTG